MEDNFNLEEKLKTISLDRTIEITKMVKNWDKFIPDYYCGSLKIEQQEVRFSVQKCWNWRRFRYDYAISLGMRGALGV